MISTDLLRKTLVRSFYESTQKEPTNVSPAAFGVGDARKAMQLGGGREETPSTLSKTATSSQTTNTPPKNLDSRLDFDSPSETPRGQRAFTRILSPGNLGWAFYMCKQAGSPLQPGWGWGRARDERTSRSLCPLLTQPYPKLPSASSPPPACIPSPPSEHTPSWRPPRSRTHSPPTASSYPRPFPRRARPSAKLQPSAARPVPQQQARHTANHSTLPIVY